MRPKSRMLRSPRSDNVSWVDASFSRTQKGYMKNLATLSHDNGEYREELTRKREALAHVEKRLAAIENPEAKAKAAAISSKISSLIEKEKQRENDKREILQTLETALTGDGTTNSTTPPKSRLGNMDLLSGPEDMGDYKIDAGKFMAQIKEEKQEAAVRSKQPSVRVNATTQNEPPKAPKKSSADGIAKTK